MKPVLKALAVTVLLAASQSALSQESPFPSYGEAIDRALPALDTYADWHARNGTLMVGSGSPFPVDIEPGLGQPALDTYADRHARNGTLMVGSGSPFPVDIEPGLGQPPLDTYADRYAREHAAPTSAEVDAGKQSIAASGRS
jgi:hypothetical protein